MFNWLLYLSTLHCCVLFIQASLENMDSLKKGPDPKRQLALFCHDPLSYSSSLYLWTAQDEAEIYRTPGSSVMFLGVDEQVLNITRVFQWEKIDKRSGNQTTTEHVLQFHVGSPNHSLIQKYNGRIHFNPLNGSFVFSDLTSADAGLYRLSINLRARVIRHVRLWIMERLSNPSIWSNGSSPGATIQLECNVKGDARRYQWQKDGMDIPHPHLGEGNRSLVLPHVTRKDCGIYTCTVSNDVSSVSAEYILTIHGLHPMDIFVIVASIVGITFSATSLIGLLVLCIIRKELAQASLQRHKRWLLLLFSSNTISLAAIFIALIFWIVIRGPASVSVVASCTASVLLVFNLSLTITVWNLGCQCITSLLDSTGLRAWMDVCGIMSSFLVLVTSIVTLVEEIQQNNQGCYVTILTWSILVPLFVIVVIIFFAFSAVWYAGNEGTNNNANIEERPEAMQLNNLNPEDEAGNGNL